MKTTGWVNARGGFKTNAVQAIKQKVYQAVEGLPPEGYEELIHFLDFLKFKYRVQQSRDIVALGGRWKDLGFDVTDAGEGDVPNHPRQPATLCR